MHALLLFVVHACLRACVYVCDFACLHVCVRVCVYSQCIQQKGRHKGRGRPKSNGAHNNNGSHAEDSILNHEEHWVGEPEAMSRVLRARMLELLRQNMERAQVDVPAAFQEDDDIINQW